MPKSFSSKFWTLAPWLDMVIYLIGQRIHIVPRFWEGWGANVSSPLTSALDFKLHIALL